MIGQIVEIQEEGRRLSLERGFLVVSTSDGPLGRVPLDDIEAVILSHPAATFSSQVVAALAERGAPFVISGPDFKPAAYVLPVGRARSWPLVCTLLYRFSTGAKATRSSRERDAVQPQRIWHGITDSPSSSRERDAVQPQPLALITALGYRSSRERDAVQPQRGL